MSANASNEHRIHRGFPAGVLSGNSSPANGDRKDWLPDMDLNHDKQIQRLLCYRYTIGQAGSAAKLVR